MPSNVLAFSCRQGAPPTTFKNRTISRAAGGQLQRRVRRCSCCRVPIQPRHHPRDSCSEWSGVRGLAVLLLEFMEEQELTQCDAHKKLVKHGIYCTPLQHIWRTSID